MPESWQKRAMASWRDIAAPIIREVIACEGRDDMKKLRRALRDAYPFGERKYLPYKVWCDEVSKQVGRSPDTTHQDDLFLVLGQQQ